MSDQALLGVIVAIALVIQVQTGSNPAPILRLLADAPVESLCTGVDLNVGCVPVAGASAD